MTENPHCSQCVGHCSKSVTSLNSKREVTALLQWEDRGTDIRQLTLTDELGSSGNKAGLRQFCCGASTFSHHSVLFLQYSLLYSRADTCTIYFCILSCQHTMWHREGLCWVELTTTHFIGLTKNSLSFFCKTYGKTWMNFLANSLYSITLHDYLQSYRIPTITYINLVSSTGSQLTPARVLN